MARDFSGTNQNINWGDVSIFDGLTALSFFCVISPDSLTPGGDGAISIVRKDGTMTALQSYDNGGGITLNFSIWNAAGVNRGHVGPAIAGITLGVSHTFQWRWAAATNGGLPKYKLDSGAWTDFSAGITVTDSVFATGTTGMFFGATETNLEDYDGRLSEVGFWNRLLTDAEGVSLAAGYAPSFFTNGLIFYAPLIGSMNPEIDKRSTTTGVVTGATKATHPDFMKYPGGFKTNRMRPRPFAPGIAR